MSIKKRRKLAHEITGDIGISLVISLFTFCFLYFMSSSIAERYMENSGRVLTDGQQYVMNVWIMSVCVIACAVLFTVLFIFMSGKRISYLTTIIREIDNLKHPGERVDIVPEGNDELTELAESINYMSGMQADMIEREKAMREERELFVRNLSHDIRTPLTSMISYSQMMSEKDVISGDEAGKYAEMMLRRSVQIKELTDRLLDDRAGTPERIDSVGFLMEQLLSEWTEMLEESFACDIAVEGDAAASVDVYAVRRILDNLASNVEKYADDSERVAISVNISCDDTERRCALAIHQKNVIRKAPAVSESRGIGLESVRQLAAMYGGSADVSMTEEEFSMDVVMYFERI